MMIQPPLGLAFTPNHRKNSNALVELDFFSMETETHVAANPNHKPKPKPKPPTQKLFERRRSFRDIQSMISKMNPEVLKAVITSGSASASANPPSSMENGIPFHSSFSVPKEHKSFLTPFPVYPTSNYRPISGCENIGGETAQLTIFYNGTVAVFYDVPRNKADYILKVAQGESFKVGFVTDDEFVRNFNGNLPLARRKSLERFFEKRKQRLMMESPYANIASLNHPSYKDA